MKCERKPQRTHKWVTALNRGKGLTYLSGENQQAARLLSTALIALHRHRLQPLYRRITREDEAVARGHAGRVFDMLE